MIERQELQRQIMLWRSKRMKLAQELNDAIDQGDLGRTNETMARLNAVEEHLSRLEKHTN